MQELPGYTLLRKLGRGGMGEVYLAVQQSLGREVALKLLTPELAQDDGARQRFLREARIAANLHHQHIVPIHDVGVHEGVAYIAMEYEPGGTVAALTHEPVEPGKALRIARDIAAALDYAHRQGVVHRDVKPENVLRRADGLCLLSDFGISRAREVPTILTHEGASVGTPQYMSPEQLRGQEIDGRSDLYGLGVMLYQMLTGALPFQGADGWALGVQHVSAPIPYLPDHLGHFQGLVDALMAKEPDARPRTGAEVVARIDALLAGRTAGATRTVETLPPRPAPAARRRIRMLAGAGLALLVVLAFAFWQPWRKGSVAPPPDASAPTSASIAVLPFADLSQNKDQAYFSDGLSEELLDLLAKVPQLRVPGRTSAFAFKDKAEDLRVIGQKLNVATVLEGSVRRSGDRVRITTQLINVADGFHLWSETYDRQMTDIFAVQDEIAGAVVAALKVKLLPQQASPQASHRSANTDAYLQYLIGRRVSLTGSRETQSAVDAFQHAIALDPNFAAAYAGLAVAELSNAQFVAAGTEVDGARARAIAAADRALELDPELAEAYAARGQLRALVKWDWLGAKVDFDRAFAMNPHDPDTLRRYAGVLMALGHNAEAVSMMKESCAVDPLSSASWNNLGYYLNSQGHFREAREALEHSIELAPKSVLGRYNLAMARMFLGDAAGAIEELGHLPPGEPFRLMGVAVAEYTLGHQAKSEESLQVMLAMPNPPAINIAYVYAWRGEFDKCFEWLYRARDRRDFYIRNVRLDRLFEKIRTDPRYPALLAEIGLAPPA